MSRCLVLLFTLVALVVAEPPLRFRSRVAFGVQQRPNTRFARLEEAPPAEQQPAGYHYPKPTSAGYHYNKPDQAFPLPGEEIPPPAATTEQTVSETTTVQEEQPTTTESTETMTTTVADEDYEDSTAALEPTDDSNTGAKLRRRPSARLTLVNRLQRQRLEEPTVTVDEQQQQQLVRPVYLINLPESTLQQLVLLNNAQLQAGLQLAPQPTAIYLSELDYIYKKK
uniref:DUF4794 domain-containing protein n=1 Tax=Anopheles farauti TaxID=69004 RepID=A0A182QS86_9DIPT